ncbi:MAG: hypothetical protein H6Q33_1896 [Deltaproteobacteria bacterium]|nr:hypothetical protein [Deltaproteobacteria bacterium]
MPRSKVAVLRTQPETVLADYQRLMEMADFQRHLDASATTILKDNISWHFPFPGANTTPWQLEGTILALRHHNYQDVVCVQNKTVVTDAFKGEDLNKYMPIFRRYNIPVLYNFKGEDMKWIQYQPKAKMLALDMIYRDYGGIQIPDYFVGKNVVHLPTVKCHIYTTTTGAIKNAFGGLLNTLRHYTHSWIHETIVDLLAIQKEIHSGLFAVMDGTTCGNGPGPRTMFPVVKNLILASADQVAIDAVAAKMMGFDPMSIKYINLAHNAGLGTGKPEEIEIVGEDVSRENWHFHVGDNLASRVGDLLWFSPLKRIQNFFFRTPLVNVFIFGSEAYHDYFRWPLKDRHTFESWLSGTAWGHLFQQYATSESSGQGSQAA